MAKGDIARGVDRLATLACGETSIAA